MNATIVTMTQQLAKDYLSRNIAKQKSEREKHFKVSTKIK